MRHGSSTYRDVLKQKPLSPTCIRDLKTNWCHDHKGGKELSGSLRGKPRENSRWSHWITLHPSKSLQNCTSWWFQPIWKILVKLDHLPRRGEHKKSLKPPPSVAFTVAPNGLSRPFGRNKAMILELYKELLKPGLKHKHSSQSEQLGWSPFKSEQLGWCVELIISRCFLTYQW